MRFPSRLIIGRGQNVTASLVGFNLCGLQQPIPPVLQSPSGFCVSRGRFTTSFMTSYALLFRCLGDFLCGLSLGNRDVEISQCAKLIQVFSAPKNVSSEGTHARDQVVISKY
ncbi:hypothetical protein AVEN_58153-1 [Araneus ventricosus]|uniref:Uncharacterized protein n=1 Tax=Araneus ventricosus TaxID=182803 RepID=A0A4Y2Q2M4_ARAVE|nr:hypothetical protein AVEN_58153-1 [Araneus ventricosus]